MATSKQPPVLTQPSTQAALIEPPPPLQPPPITQGSPLVDRELRQLFSLFTRDFVRIWFQPFVSPTDQDLERLLHSDFLAHTVRALEHRLRQLDWVELLLEDLPFLLRRHVEDFRGCREKQGTVLGGHGLLSVDQLFQLHQPHISLMSSENEWEYMREWVDCCLLNNGDLVAPAEGDIAGLRLLLREILASVLLHSIYQLGRPEYLHELLVSALSGDSSSSAKKSRKQVMHDSREQVRKWKQKQRPDSTRMAKGSVDTEAITLPSSSRRASRQVQHGKSASMPSATGLLRMESVTPPPSKGIAAQQDAPPQTPSLDSTPAQPSLSPSIDKDVDSSLKLRDRSNAAIVSNFTSTSPDAPPADTSQDPTPSPLTSLLSVLLSLLGTLFSLLATAARKYQALQHDFYLGPRFLGPIDTSKYMATSSFDASVNSTPLEQQWLLASNAVLQLDSKHPWLWSQVLLFLLPLLHLSLGNLWRKMILRNVYWMLEEERVAWYIRSARESFWPNNQWAPTPPPKSPEEKQRLRKECELVLKQLVSNPLRRLLTEQTVEEAVQLCMDVMDRPLLNRHLLFVLLDTVGSKLVAVERPL